MLKITRLSNIWRLKIENGNGKYVRFSISNSNKKFIKKLKKIKR